MEDFDADQVTLLMSALPVIDEPDLRARIGDVAWLAARDHHAARVAVRAYVDAAQSLENAESWPPAMLKAGACRADCAFSRQGL